MKYISLITLSICLFFSGHAQDFENQLEEDFFHPLKLKFSVMNTSGEAVKASSFKLFANNTVVENITVKSNRHTVKCLSNEIYTLEISHPDYATKRIAVNAFHENKPLYNDVYKFNVELEPKSAYDGLTDVEDYLDYPAVILEYDEASAEFTYNEEYILNTRLARLDLVSSNSISSNP